MRNALFFFLGLVLILANAHAQPTTAPSGGIPLTSGWSELIEGQAQASVEQNLPHPSSSSAHLLHIMCSKTAAPGEGRAGATCTTTIAVKEGQWFDVTFIGMNERGSSGLVFSLETADGKVLARTTLPEIGRRLRGPPGAATASTQPTWNNYLVSLHARGSDPAAHMTVTPIESTSVWLDGLTITPRQ